MDRKEIILLIAVGVFAAFSIYKKYFRKDSTGKSESKGNFPGKSTSDNDYEPYSGTKE